MRRLMAVVLLLVTVGCDGSDEGTRSPEETQTRTLTYPERVIALCSALIDEVVPITGDSAPWPTRDRYLEQSAQLAPIYARFDAAVAALEVGEGEEEVADAFKTYVEKVAAANADLVARAPDMNAQQFKAAARKHFESILDLPEREVFRPTGIECLAR